MCRELVPVCHGRWVAAKPVHCQAHGTRSLLQNGEARRCELSVQIESADAARVLQEGSFCNRHSVSMTPSKDRKDCEGHGRFFRWKGAAGQKARSKLLSRARERDSGHVRRMSFGAFSKLQLAQKIQVFNGPPFQGFYTRICSGSGCFYEVTTSSWWPLPQ